jgi:hypothetical protein
MEDKKIKLERRRNTAFTVNCPKTNKTFIWNGAVGNKIDSREVPQDTYDWLFMSTTTLTAGELVPCEIEDIEELKDSLDSEDKEKIENNVNTRKSIVDMLSGDTNSMKAKLKKITEKSEKTFIIDVAREIKLDSSAKREFLSKWIGYEIDFSEDDAE